MCKHFLYVDEWVIYVYGQISEHVNTWVCPCVWISKHMCVYVSTCVSESGSVFVHGSMFVCKYKWMGEQRYMNLCVWINFWAYLWEYIHVCMWTCKHVLYVHRCVGICKYVSVGKYTEVMSEWTHEFIPMSACVRVSVYVNMWVCLNVYLWVYFCLLAFFFWPRC